MWCAFGCRMLSFLLARVSCTWGIFTSVYLLSQCTFTCDGKHDAHLRESKSSHIKSGKQMHYWVRLNPAKCIQVDVLQTAAIHVFTTCMYLCILSDGGLKDAADCLASCFHIPTSVPLLPHLASALLIYEQSRGYNDIKAHSVGWVCFKCYWAMVYLNYAHHPMTLYAIRAAFYECLTSPIKGKGSLVNTLQQVIRWNKQGVILLHKLLTFTLNYTEKRTFCCKEPFAAHTLTSNL